MNYTKMRIIVEAGCNHKGEMEIVKELIKIAAIYSKADNTSGFLEFSKEDIDSVLSVVNRRYAYRKWNKSRNYFR